MKRLGPELKMPDLKGLKAPDFLVDLYYDLRDRRLLPLVALVVVAIVALPFLLGGDAEEPAPAPAAGAAAVEQAEASGARLAVVEAKPGLRDYRKRLRRRSPTDPFAQQYTGVPKQAQLRSIGVGSEGGAAGAGGGPVEGGGEGGPESSPPDTGGTGGAKPGGSGGGGKPQTPRLYTFVLDLQISRSETTPDGGQKMGAVKVRHGVRPLTPLPGKKAPVVTTMGINLHTAKAMFLVSDDVSSLDGEFRCVARTPTGLCELLEVRPGFPFTLVYGPNEVRYRIKVTGIDVIRSGRVGDGRTSSAAREAGYRMVPAPYGFAPAAP